MKEFKTSDIGLASYILLKGGRLISARRGKPGYEILFDNSDSSCDRHAVEYLNSEFMKYDMYSKNLRVLLKNQK
mgnify:FL=1